MMQSPHTLIGLGDGGAHVGLISDGSFPTSLLTHWGRDRAQGRLDVSWLVKRQTLDNARAVGLNDRGKVAPSATRPTSTSSTSTSSGSRRR